MPASGGPSAGPGFRFRRLEKPEEFRQAEELQRSAGGSETNGIVPTSIERSLQDNGGLVLGAFADIYLAGCAISTLGWDGTALYHYSFATLVRPEYRNHHLGFRLKSFQRDEVLGLGLSEIRWVFDPLGSRPAALYFRRLGAFADRYFVHYFGQPSEEGERGEETDRLRVRWPIAAPRVEQRLKGAAPTPDDDRGMWSGSKPIIETESGPTGLRLPTSVNEPDGLTAHLEIPFDLAALREHEPASVRRWRHAVRDAFRGAFDLGYSVDDFAVISLEHERRSFYFLSKSTPPAAGGPKNPP